MTVFMHVSILMFTLVIGGIRSLQSCPEFCSTSCDQTSGICNQGCRTNAWGVYCERKCPDLCYGSTCSQSNGSCLYCQRGRWGKYCENQCSVFCSNLSCDDKGKCINGCENGRYGMLCREKCSSGCIGDLCHQQDGTCVSGCRAQYYGLRCEKRSNSNCQPPSNGNQSETCNTCRTGFYGQFCTNICSRNCFNNICDSKDGNCTQGCESEWTGEKCDVKSLIKASKINFELLISICLGLLLVICCLIFIIRRCGRFLFSAPSNTFSSSTTQETTGSVPGIDVSAIPIGSEDQANEETSNGLSGASQSSAYEGVIGIPQIDDFHSYDYPNQRHLRWL